MKSNIVFLTLLSFLLISCDSIVSKYAFYPDKKTSIAQTRLPSYIHKVSFETNDNILIHGLLFKHDNNKNSNNIIIYFHGNAGNMYHRIEEANELFNMNCDVLIVSYRGYADSEGTPSEKGIYLDGEAAYQFVINKLGFNSTQIIIYGRSIGTTVAIDVAQNKNIRDLILITPFTTGYELVKQMNIGSIGSFVGNSFNSVEKLNSIHCPLLVIHGTDDEVIPYKLGQMLYEKYPNSKTFISIKNGKHNNLEYVEKEKYYDSIMTMINSK